MSPGNPKNVILFVNGFPDVRRPNQGVFNQRAAMALAKRVALTVIVPVAIKPGRPLLAVERRDGMVVVRLAGPVIPGASRLTLLLFRQFTESKLAPFLAKADIVHSVGVEFAGLLAGTFRKNFRYRHLTQVINDLRNLRSPEFRRYPYLDTLRHNLHGIVCNSRTLEEMTRQYFPDVRVMRTAYRGADLNLFIPKEAGGKSSGVMGPMRFLYLGGLPPYPDRAFGVNTKGGVTLMNAWTRGEEQFHQARSSLLFGGPCSTSDLARQWLGRLKYPDAVRLVGEVAASDVPAELRAAGIVVIPSMEEGCPNLAFESLACGMPVLASNIGPLAEVVSDGECGRTFPAGNADALQQLMVEYSKPGRDEIIHAMGAAARKRAEDCFDSRDYVERLLGIYDELE